MVVTPFHHGLPARVSSPLGGKIVTQVIAVLLAFMTVTCGRTLLYAVSAYETELGW